MDIDCSFCGDPKTEDVEFIKGNSNAHICLTCVMTAKDLLGAEVTTNLIKGHSLKPKEIVTKLDSTVIGQSQAKKIISVAIYNHFKRIGGDPELADLDKSNILLIGESGSSKTLLAQSMAKLLDIPFAIADATTLTESGYVGEDSETIIQRLLMASDFEPEKAQRGIIFIDEIDKIAKKSQDPSVTRDVSGEGVQQSLLKLIEGTTVHVPLTGKRKNPEADTIAVDTSNILFICAGAFSGMLPKENTPQKKRIGFNVKEHPSLSTARDSDDIKKKLQKFGLIPEFIGRLPVICKMDAITEELLVRILTEPENSIISQYQKLFRSENVELTFEHEALLEIAKKAIDEGTGARGLRSILEALLLESMYEIPSIEDVSKIAVTKSCIKSNVINLLYDLKAA